MYVTMEDSIVEIIETVPPAVVFSSTGKSNGNKSKVKKSEIEKSEVDNGNNYNYVAQRNVAEGMMDIALLTANANQLRFVITYNAEAKTYYVSLVLIVLSLMLQVAVGITLIFKRHIMKNRAKKDQVQAINNLIIGGVFIVTVINVLIASFTTTDDSSGNGK